MKLVSSTQIFENKSQTSGFIKIRVRGAELFHTNSQPARQAGRQIDERTDGYDKTNCRFSRFFERA
jgi:hypothetical protein